MQIPIETQGERKFSRCTRPCIPLIGNYERQPVSRGQAIAAKTAERHINHDPANPQAELKALCPACHMKHDRHTERPLASPASTHRQGYQVISETRLVREARGAGLHIGQQGDRYCWQVGDMSGIATDVLDAIGSALHCLVMERLEEQEEVRA